MPTEEVEVREALEACGTVGEAAASRSGGLSLSREALRLQLVAKARAGRFDIRMSAYSGVDPKVNRGCDRPPPQNSALGARRQSFRAPSASRKPGPTADCFLKRRPAAKRPRKSSQRDRFSEGGTRMGRSRTANARARLKAVSLAAAAGVNPRCRATSPSLG